MMIRKTITMTIILLLFIMIVPLGVVGQENSLPAPGILPDHPLYGIKIAFERLTIALTFDNDAKIDRHIHYADRRASEIERLKDYDGDDKTRIVSMAEVRRQSHIGNAVRIIEDTIEDDNIIRERLAEIQLRVRTHIRILNEIKETLPEPARAGINIAISNSNNAIDRAMDNTDARR